MSPWLSRFFGRRGLGDLAGELEGAVRHARLSAMKLRVAENVLRESRKGAVDRLLIQTALTGFPLSSDSMANMYVKSAIDSARKALRKVKFVRDVLERDYPHVYVGVLRGFIEPVITTLESVALLDKIGASELSVKAEEMEGAASMLSEATELLRNTAKLHGE